MPNIGVGLTANHFRWRLFNLKDSLELNVQIDTMCYRDKISSLYQINEVTKMYKRRTLLQQLGKAIVFTLGLCLSALAFSASPVLDRITEQRVLKVAMSGEQQPFNFTYGKSKSIIGFDVDLANALAGLMNVKLEIVQLPFDELLEAVESGKADMVISGMTITPERSRSVSFVGPYMLSGKSLLVTNKLMASAKSGSGFNDSSVKLAALKGSTSESIVEQKLPEASLRTIANYDEGVDMLLRGKVDGLVADMPILALTRQSNRDAQLQLVTPPISTEPLGMAIAQGDPQFENLLRNYMLVFEKTGLYVRLHERWFELGNSNLYTP